MTNISGSAPRPFHFKILAAAILLAVCPNLCAGQESLCAEGPADAALRLALESGVPSPDDLEPPAEEAAYPLRLSKPTLPGISASEMTAWQFPFPRLDAKEESARRSFDWKEAVKQSFLLLTVQHTLRLAIEPNTRANVQGPFLKDYFRTLTSLRGWRDGDSFATNYVGHPMMGAISGFIQVHNDPAGIRQTIDVSKAYRDSRLKALAWSAAYSLQFELGLFSEASIGNVGMYPRKTSKHPMAFVDLVVTPVVGTSWLIGEDALDRYLIDPIERRTSNRTLRNLARSFFNPTRSLANLLRFKRPWHRDTR